MWTFDPVPPPVVRSLTLYGGGEEHEAAITLTPWGTRERLRYTDLAAARGSDRDEEGRS